MDLSAFQNSIFLQALGGALLNSVWQAAILWLLYETIFLFFKKATAAFRFNLSFIFLCIGFTWFLKDLVSMDFHSNAISGGFQNTGTGATPAPATFPTWQLLVQYLKPSLPFLSFAYMVLLSFFSLKLIASYQYVYRISRKGLILPPQTLSAFTDTVRGQMKMARKIKLWISEVIDVPATIGFFKPIILIPIASLNHLSADQLEAIIIHELAHIKRNDYLANIVITIIDTILFFNPFFALLIRTARKERENCCDDNVLRYNYNPHGYALALLRLEQSRLNSVRLALGAVSGKKQLLTRIKRITGGNVIHRQLNYGQKLLALLAVTAIFCSLAWLSPVRKNVSTAKRIYLDSSASFPARNLSKLAPMPLVLRQPAGVGILNTVLDYVQPGTARQTLSLQAGKWPKVQKDIQINLPKEDWAQLLRDQFQIQILQLNKSKQFLINLAQNGITLSAAPAQMPKSEVENLDININPENIALSKINEQLKYVLNTSLPSGKWNQQQGKILNDILNQATRTLTAKKHEWQFNWSNSGKKGKMLMADQNHVKDLQKAQIVFQDSSINAKLVLLMHSNRKVQEILTQIQRNYSQPGIANPKFKIEYIKETAIE